MVVAKINNRIHNHHEYVQKKLKTNFNIKQGSGEMEYILVICYYDVKYLKDKQQGNQY